MRFREGKIVAITPENVHRPGMKDPELNMVVVRVGRRDHAVHFEIDDLPFRAGDTVQFQIQRAAHDYMPPQYGGAIAFAALRVQLADCPVPTDYMGLLREVKPAQ